MYRLPEIFEGVRGFVKVVRRYEHGNRKSCASRELAESCELVLPEQPNFAFKLMRPAFGPALKRLGRTVPARRHTGCKSQWFENRGSRRAALP
jgi:hypothetical protein